MFQAVMDTLKQHDSSDKEVASQGISVAINNCQLERERHLSIGEEGVEVDDGTKSTDPALDGGYGWVVVLGSYLSHLVIGKIVCHYEH